MILDAGLLIVFLAASWLFTDLVYERGRKVGRVEGFRAGFSLATDAVNKEEL
jgi:hypothetical protein